MTGYPAFFEPIRLKAAQRWEQLEQDPELAGPWHVLFKQVQSPRHVLSELLQNADDAGASEASVRIENGVFHFEHNGEDFTAEHFASLCRFGYSNKRTLHTIGFRGIGFKSTFSLGDSVDLVTPTLAVRFDRTRFTEPRWILEDTRQDGMTCVRVAIRDRARQREVEKNLEEWLKSPLSMLFFRSIRRLQIGERLVHWSTAGPGPVLDSDWMAFNGQSENPLLVIRSPEESFPEDAVTEIKQERLLGSEDDAVFPPCRVEIVMGAEGRLFVVLPTGVATRLPFACNGPFIQDPARLKIKDPETSPTNRWLLQRAGKLAAQSMLDWLGQREKPAAQRASAYGLLPDVDRDDNSLEGICGALVEEAFEETIKGASLLLTDSGDCTPPKGSVIIPAEIAAVWSPNQAAALLDDQHRPALCARIQTTDQQKLLNWGFAEQISKWSLLYALTKQHFPRPKTWQQLLLLWEYVESEVTRYYSSFKASEIHIVPVQGKNVLYQARDVVRLGEKKLLQSDDDWTFLSDHLTVLNPNWPRFLTKARRIADEQKDTKAQVVVEAAYAVLGKMQLEDASDVNKIIDRVATDFFAPRTVNRQQCIQLAQIAAKLNAAVGDSFNYVTRDGLRRTTRDYILFDEDSTLEELVAPELRETHLLHGDYLSSFVSCSRDEWLRWVASGRSALHTFLPILPSSQKIYRRWHIEDEARRRGHKSGLSYPYVTDNFIIEDWDFQEAHWRHWRILANEDEGVWARIVDRILSRPQSYWNQARSARVLQIATTGNTKPMTYEPLLPGWALRLRELPCLRDTRGFRHKPGKLLRRTPQTEPLLDTEPFVSAQLDTEKARPLLQLLGVRNIPTGPDRLLDNLRALSKTEKPPVHEVERWYRRLDQMVDTCSTSDFQKIKQAFWTEKLILVEDGGWTPASAAFLTSDEHDIPGTAILRSSVSDLALWRKIGLAERPTADLAIQWLSELPSSQTLSQEDAQRVRALLVRYPIQIWEECEHWLNLAGEWVSIERLAYALTLQSLIRWQHFHPWVKQKTADLQRLRVEVTSNPPFSVLSALADHVQERIHQSPVLVAKPETKVWLTTFGTEFQRIQLDDENDTHRIRKLSEALSNTKWHVVLGLESIPYIDGTPAGTPRQVDVLWLDGALYVDQLPRAKLAKRVPEEIGKAFGRSDIKAALDYSFERSADHVREYLEENFKLAPRANSFGPAIDDTGVESSIGTIQHLPPTDQETPRPDVVLIGDGADDGPMSGVGQDEAVTGMQDDTISPGDSTLPDDEGQGWIDSPKPPVARPPHPDPKPIKLSILERFAIAQGFRKETEERYFHGDGSWLGRIKDNSFPWERRTPSGDLMRYYWAKDHCLEREPLQLEADIWWQLEKKPDTHALILSNLDGNPIEVTGARLCAMHQGGQVTLYPSTYRLVFNYDSQT